MAILDFPRTGNNCQFLQGEANRSCGAAAELRQDEALRALGHAPNNISSRGAAPEHQFIEHSSQSVNSSLSRSVAAPRLRQIIFYHDPRLAKPRLGLSPAAAPQLVEGVFR